jgi:vitamin B12 transporter
MLIPSYLINKQFKLFANFSSAYRTPSLYQLFSEYGNKDLKPEAATTFEGGLQYFSRGNKLTGRLVGFRRNLKDAIAFTSGYVNQDKQKDNGIELEAAYTITKNTTVKAFILM